MCGFYGELFLGICVFSYHDVTGLNVVVAYTKARHFGNTSGCIPDVSDEKTRDDYH